MTVQTYSNATIFLGGKPLCTGDMSIESMMASPNITELTLEKRGNEPTRATYEATFVIDANESDALFAFVRSHFPGPPDVQVNLPRPPSARPLTRRQVAALCEGTRRGLAEIGGFAGRVVPAPELVAHLEERRRARNKRKAARKRNALAKVRRARAGLSRREPPAITGAAAWLRIGGEWVYRPRGPKARDSRGPQAFAPAAEAPGSVDRAERAQRAWAKLGGTTTLADPRLVEMYADLADRKGW